MVYEVYATEDFENEISNLPKKELRKVKRIFLQLRENPYVGDSIRYRFLREKRIYYLIYEEWSAVLIVAIGGKKEQQEMIDKIIKYFPDFKNYMKKLLGR